MTFLPSFFCFALTHSPVLSLAFKFTLLLYSTKLVLEINHSHAPSSLQHTRPLSLTLTLVLTITPHHLSAAYDVRSIFISFFLFFFFFLLHEFTLRICIPIVFVLSQTLTSSHQPLPFTLDSSSHHHGHWYQS